MHEVLITLSHNGSYCTSYLASLSFLSYWLVAPTQRMFYENCKGHVEGHFFGGAERPHISGNFPDFCVEIFHKKLEGFQK